MVKIFDTQVLLDIYPKLPFTHRGVEEYLEQFTTLGEKNVDIVFVEKKYIKKLNKEYRSKDEVTDVLSFKLDTKDLLGEVYICPQYIYKKFSKKKFIEEIIRLCVHGVLHLQGEDHTKKFDKVDYKDEPMYINQEEIVDKMLNKLIKT
ncbi:rRNA maturation RNase YbeY [bacterium]|nr:rRNA maturation RNase YbeY [bacterium]